METMSQVKMAWEGGMNPKVFVNKQAKDCLLPMGITSENVAARYGVSRKEQDGQSDTLRRSAGCAPLLCSTVLLHEPVVVVLPACMLTLRACVSHVVFAPRRQSSL